MTEFTISIEHLASISFCILSAVLAIACCSLLIRHKKLKSELLRLHAKLHGYSTIIDAETHIADLKSKVGEDVAVAKRTVDESAIISSQKQGEIEIQTVKLAELNAQIEQCRSSLDLLSAIQEMQEFGIFEPRFNFEHSDEYKAEISACVAEQKAMVKFKTACVCETEWTVNDNRRAGQTMTNRNIKLMLRAFNGECTGIVAKVTYRTLQTSENKIIRAFSAVNKLGASNQIQITDSYRDFKLRELSLTYEHERIKQDEKEQERERRERLKEQEKAVAEIETAISQADVDEAKINEEIEIVQTKILTETGDQLEELKSLISELKHRLAETLDRKARAIARAQLTNSGHVYILSNLGAFGEGVFKIGLTRRLNPYERVKELASASVPFPFDVHAMIFSEDAPALEKALHRHFSHNRINLVNLRKEYFSVTLDDLASAVAELHGNVTFMDEMLASEYRETIGKRKEQAAIGETKPLPLTLGDGIATASSQVEATELVFMQNSSV